MKKKILFALAMPAILAACSNEEIVEMQSSEMEKVVGAELVSNGMTINFSGDAESRMTSEGQFDETDKLGLGWITTTGPSTKQEPTVAPNLNKLYGNHLFVKNGEADNAFTTYGNVYTGWHFAYYPYTRMPEVDQMKIDNINPAMTKEYTYQNGTKAEYLENRFHISAKDFIQPTDVDANNALVGKKFNLIPMVSTLTVATKVENDILNEADLKSLKINKVELDAGKGMLYSKAELNPQNLPSAVYTGVDPTSKVQLEYDAAETKKRMTVANLFCTDDTKAIKKTGKGQILSTEIDVESYKLDGTKELRMNILPIDEADLYATAAASAITLKVYVDGGYFTIAYTAPKKDENGDAIPYTTTETTNNTAIERVAKLLSVAGLEGQNWSKLIENRGVRVSLAKENFTADYTGIMTIDNWNGCVKVANALGADKTPVFSLGLNARVEFPAGKMNVPNKGVELTSDAWGENQLIFNNKTEWNSAISRCDNGTTIVVGETGELTVNNAMWASRIVNNGTILAGEKASVGDAKEDRFENEGRVIVKYGAYIYPSAGKEGIIAYNVDGEESAAKINTLVATTGTQNGYAKVNTLIVENNVALDLTKKDDDSEDDDRYHGSQIYGDALTSLANVTIEMNGGTVKAKQGNVKDVYNVVVKGGENFVTDVNLKGDLIVEAGKITVDATEYGVTEIVDGKQVIEMVKDAVIADNIVNNSEVVANVDVFVADINNEEGTVVVNKPYTVWYSNEYIQGGTAKGNILKYDASTKFLADLETVKDGGTVTLTADVELSEALKINKNVTIDLNGKTLTNSQSLSSPATYDIAVSSGKSLTIINGEIITNNTAVCSNGGNVTLKNCNLTDNTVPGNLIYAESGTLIMEDCVCQGLGQSETGKNRYTVVILDGCEATLKNTKVSGVDGGVTARNNNTKVDIVGGEYTGYVYHGLVVVDGAKCEFDATATFDNVYAIVNGSETVEVNGQSYTGTTKIK